LNVRTTICTLMGVLALLVLFALTPKPVLAPKGIVLPAQQVRAPISADHVMIYHRAPSATTVTLGQIRVELGFNNQPNEDTKMALFQKIKSLAASVGANGVIVNYLVSNDGIRKMITFIGTAVYVPQSASRSAQ